jgi:hypothetical protein
MLFRETITVYFENNKGHINLLYEQNSEFSCVQASCTYGKHFALNL